MDNREQLIRDYLAEESKAVEALPMVQILEAIDLIKEARRNRKKIFTMGNGGSSATASHMAVDFAKNTRDCDLPSIRTICLSDCTPAVTAFANDEGYETIFAEQLKILADPGDVLIGISGSGNSANILNALTAAKALGVKTIGFSGFKGGKMIGMVDIPIIVDTDSIERVEVVQTHPLV